MTDERPPGGTGERTPWMMGSVVGAIAAVMTTVVLGGLGVELVAVNAVFAVVVMTVVIGGAAPAVLRYRSIPVWRWMIHGAAAGAVLSMLVTVVVAVV